MLFVVFVVIGILLLGFLAYQAFWFEGPPLSQPRPLVTFRTADKSLGNATIGVAGVSQAVSPSSYRVNLQVGSNPGTAIGMPTTGGQYVSLTITGATYRIYWTDADGGRTLNPGDAFRVTGTNLPLPAAKQFTFYLLWSDGSLIQSALWTMP